MSRGAWKRSVSDQVEVVQVPMRDAAQVMRWYEAWRILVRAMRRLEPRWPARYHMVGVGKVST